MLAASLAFALTASADEPGPPEVRVAAGQGLTVTSADGHHRLTVRARFVPRLDVTVADPAAEAKTRVTIATARLWVEGHVFTPKLRYVVQLAVAARDFRDGPSPLFDAYLDWRVHRDASLRVGQYFVPFDRLRTVREFSLQMTDRPRPVAELSLDRDVGVTLYSDHLGADRSPFAYRLGVFGGGGLNATEARPAGALFVARAELRPLGDVDDDSEGDLARRARPGLALGAAVAYGLRTSRERANQGANFADGTIDTLHVAADLTFKWHGLALQGEYLRREALGDDAVTGVAADGTPTTSWARSGHGWVAQGSVFFPPGLELVLRGSQTFALGATSPSLIADVDARGDELAAGLNAYLNGHRFKIQTTWVALFRGDPGQAQHSVATQLDAMF